MTTSTEILKEKTFERTLIKEDRNILDKMERQVKQFLPNLNKVKGAYKSLDLGEYTTEIHQEVLNVGDEDIANRYRTALTDELDRSKVMHKVLRKQILDGSEPPLHEFQKAVRELKSFYPKNGQSDIGPSLQLDQISYQDGAFIISEEDKEAILEQHCRRYLENEQDQDFLDKLTSFAKAYNGLHEHLEERGVLRYFKPTNIHPLNLGALLKFKENRDAEVNHDVITGIKKFTTNN